MNLGKTVCGSQHDGWICSRDGRHKGQHWAEVAGQRYAAWQGAAPTVLRWYL